MSALLSCRRTTLRAMAVCAAVTATVLGPAAGAFAAGPGQLPGSARAVGSTPADAARCTVAQPTDTFLALPKGCTVRRGMSDGGTYVRTVKLADGVSVAKIYRMGPGHFRAEGFAYGSSFGSIEATQAEPYVAGNLNGLITALSSQGELVSWIAQAGPSGPHVETLADGKTVARVTRLGDQHYRAVLVDAGGRTVATMEVDGDATFRSAVKVGSVWAVLETDGSVTSHVQG
ncbi:hypothetical protein [Streptomyces sp. NPDC093097]|uniref:hypothetical protein n=1 Tax=Streptomyces sp. NPDC093097 TaxID=3366027 RepID=UPI003829B968